MDNRPLKIIAKIEDENARTAWTDVVTKLLVRAEDEGRDLQFEFGKEHVSFIVGCNQFLRVYKSGDYAATGELLPGPNFTLTAGDAVGGMVFKMFGWKQVNVQAGLAEATLEAYEAAAAKAAPSL